MAFDPISAIANLGSSIIDRVLPDKAANDAAKAKLLELQLSGELQQMTGQMDINKAEASSSSIFVAGWRPFLGWICGTALASDMIVRPLFMWGAGLLGKSIVYPQLDLSTLLTLLGGMLGFGAMRSFDKMNGAGNGH